MEDLLYVVNGYMLGFGTIGLIIFLEFTNTSIVVKIIEKHGISHYLKAWITTIINSVLIGPNVYRLVGYLWIDREPHAFITNIVNVNKTLIVHSFGYWVAHNLMHIKCMWFIHKFHHTYSLYVTPVVANAVSPMEYGFAYMLPFILASYVINLSNIELLISAGIVSVCNLIIHCPSLKWMGEYYPKWWVSPQKHLIHHRTKKGLHIAASTIDVDYIVSLAKFS
tara:strand:- start:956 stop:1624 length:669 start_codon:yes stop_codon:yes gene_type:complete